MKMKMILALCLLVLSGCASTGDKEVPKEQKSAGIINASNSAASNAEMPPTTKEENAGEEFVSSETGTEKGKPAPGTANVQGKVFYNEKPVANIEVKLCEKFNSILGGCTGEKFTTKTDAGGEYLLANVKPSVYEALIVYIFDTKSYIFASKKFGISAAKYKIEGDKTFFAPPTNLFKTDLKIQNPKSNAKVDAQNFEIKWDAYPDAAYYKLSVSPDNYVAGMDYPSAKRIETNSFKPEQPLPNGSYRLSIQAFNANEMKLSENNKAVEFTVSNGKVVSGGETTANTNN